VTGDPKWSQGTGTQPLMNADKERVHRFALVSICVHLRLKLFFGF
jgi:hypothetical protein